MLCRQGTGRHASTKGALLERFAKYINEIEVADAEKVIDRALMAEAPRRRLPGSGLKRGGEAAGRYLATAAVAILAAAAEAGDRAAELLLLYAPRLFMRRGTRVEQQLADLIEGRIAITDAKATLSPERRWVAAIEAALIDGDLRRLCHLILRGPTPSQDPAVIARINEHVDRLYPQQPAFANECTRWRALRASIHVAREGFSAADMKRWAHKHTTSSGGSSGWTGALLLHVWSADSKVGAQLARLWSRAPEEWYHDKAAELALRSTDGWLLPKDDGGFRPIAAPQVVRRIGSAALMKRAKPLVERYCRERLQFGLSGDAHTIAYSLLPLLTVSTGGTVLAADRSQSFQTLRRDAIYAAVKDVVEKALPSEADAAAALVDACLEYYVQTPDLRKSTVDFDDIPTVTVDGLAQGCTLSPTLEALVLAWHHSRSPVKPGMCRLTAHDDLIIVGGTTTPPSAFTLPSCMEVGGDYNLAKSVAYGADRDALVQTDLAASEATIGTVWGRPVGRVSKWLETTWLPRFETRCERIMQIAAVDAAVAIWCANALKGPGAMVTHVLRGIPPTMLEDPIFGGPAALATLRRADTMWVELLLCLAGADKPSDGFDADTLHRAHKTIFGREMGHLSAFATARAAATAGMATAFPTLMRVAKTHALDSSAWAGLLGLPELSHPGGLLTSSIVRMHEELLARATHEREQHTLFVDSLGGGQDLNLWVEATKQQGPIHVAVKAACGAAQLPETRIAAVRFALARVLRVPVWKAVGVIAPHAGAVGNATECVLCRHASNFSAAVHDGPSGGANSRTAGGVRAQYDDQGVHAGVCGALGPAASMNVRHDRAVRACVEIGLQCGINSRAHDGPVFDRGPAIAERRKRPADWLEQGNDFGDKSANKYIWARLYDFTLTSADPEKAEQRKREHYQPGLAAHPHYAFTPCGASLTGAIGSGAKETLHRWAASLVRHRKVTADLPGRPLQEVMSAFAFCFATVVTLQVAAYTNDVMAKKTNGRSRLELLGRSFAAPMKRQAEWRATGAGGRSNNARPTTIMNRGCGGASAAATGDTDSTPALYPPTQVSTAAASSPSSCAEHAGV
jgi:hypothetical protein